MAASPVSQLTVKTPSTGSGTALTTAMFIPYLKMKYASRLDTSCFIKDVPLFHPGRPTALSEVIVRYYLVKSEWHCDSVLTSDVITCGVETAYLELQTPETHKKKKNTSQVMKPSESRFKMFKICVS